MASLRILSAVSVAVCWLDVGLAAAGEIVLEESLGQKTYSVTADVTIDGEIRTHGDGGTTDSRPLQATASFAFAERSAEPADDESRLGRVLRIYRTAKARTDVDGFQTTTSLDPALKRVVVAGRDGMPVRFSLDGLMTRESLDLLDMPGDPMALSALLPTRGVELDEAYDIPEWAAQTLCSLEVLTEADLVGRVRSATEGAAHLSVSGTVEGARLGAPTKLEITGSLTFDRAAGVITRATLAYVERAEIGTISPGVQATTKVDLVRRESNESVSLAGIPKAIPASAMKLYLDAPSWGVRMLHDRDWHVFYSSPDGAPAVVILRLLENGRLLSQVNLAKLATAAPGEHATPAQFRGDIVRSLGNRFGAIVDETSMTRPDEVSVTRVVVTGSFDYKQADETKTRPMQWVYYLLVHPDGRQFSAVFAQEPDLAEQLAGRDEELIGQLKFFSPRIAAARKRPPASR